MNTPEILDKISRALGMLTSQINLESATGLTSKNRLAEDLLIPVLASVYNLPGLINANSQNFNSPVIDLVDVKKRLTIQVTSTTTASKISDTLTGFRDKGLKKNYNRIWFLILTSKKPKYTAKTLANWGKILPKAVRFDPKKDIKIPADIFEKCKSLPFPELQKLYEVIRTSMIGESYVERSEEHT